MTCQRKKEMAQRGGDFSENAMGTIEEVNANSLEALVKLPGLLQTEVQQTDQAMTYKMNTLVGKKLLGVLLIIIEEYVQFYVKLKAVKFLRRKQISKWGKK